MTRFQWPWVSRDRLTWLEGELTRERTLHAATLDRLYAKEAVWDSRMTAQPAALPVPQPDPVTRAILAKSHGNPALHRHYNTVVAERRAQRSVGLLTETEEDLAAAILHGVDDDQGVPMG